MTATIAERMADCLHRQIASFKATRDDLRALDDVDDLGGPGLLETHHRHLKETMQLEEELQLLMPEWKSAAPPPAQAERERIAALATEAQVLADELGELYESVQVRAEAYAAKLKGDRDSLRTQKGALRYHPKPGDDPKQMDRKA